MAKLSPPIAVTHQFLKSLSIKHSLYGLEQKLDAHPDFPNMLAISDCLTEWQIPNLASQIVKETYSKLPFPFVAHLNSGIGSFILVKSIQADQISYNDGRLNNLMSETEFLKNFSGIVLQAEADESSGEPEYKKNRWTDWLNNIKLPLLLLILVGGIGLAIDYDSLRLSYCLLLFITILGVVNTILLLINSIDTNNPLVQNLCSLGSKNGCNTILRTEAAKLINWLSWSEIGFFYFAGSFLSLLFFPVTINLLAWFYILSLPYPIYSITYQYKHKNWCVLCCVVQILLLLGASVAVGFGLLSFTPASLTFLPSVFYLLFSFLLPVVSWYMIRPLFAQSVQFKPLKQQLKKFKYNSELFNQALKNQPRYTVDNEMMPVVLGNPNAETIITMVSNPFCGPCAKAHQVIDEWLKHRNDLQLKIIFTTANHDDDQKTKVSRHISALTTLDNTQLLEDALNDWYAQRTKNYDQWAKNYPVTFNDQLNDIAEKQKKWCDMAEIAFTPTILVNGYKLPEPYRLEDIRYLIN